MKSKLKKIIYLVIGLLIAFLPNNTLIFNEGAQTELSIPKQSAGYIESFIHVDGNWSDTAVDYDWCSGEGSWANPYIIENVTVDCGGTGSGILIENSDTDYFIIRNCTVYGAGSTSNDGGIKLDNINNGTLTNNNCSNNLRYGIYLLNDCNNNTILGNTVNDNGNSGIYLEYSNNNTLSGNIAFKNGQVGIWLSWSDNNTILKNTVNDNENSGIYLGHSDYITILGNNAKGNFIGIWIWECHTIDITGNNVNGSDIGIGYEGCENSTNSGNNVNGNNYGIWIYDNCYNNNFTGNTVNDNNYGIYLQSGCDYNDIIDNIFYNNTLGIFIDSSSDSNSIYENFFLENGKHAEDDGTDNTWNSTTIGNYWDNWTTPDISPNDGIVDLQYNISGSAGSIDYLPIAEDGAPVIVINSPTSSDVFGVTAPSFDVTITDVYVDSMWYTIDGGINNYTFIENGIINQTAWAALTEGDVIITFYAKDIIGNEASEAVTVVKMFSAAGLEPGIIITIVVVSVAGGVAAVAVIYLYLKKRKSPK